jgi:hypothetical protein
MTWEDRWQVREFEVRVSPDLHHHRESSTIHLYMGDVHSNFRPRKPESSPCKASESHIVFSHSSSHLNRPFQVPSQWTYFVLWGRVQRKCESNDDGLFCILIADEHSHACDMIGSRLECEHSQLPRSGGSHSLLDTPLNLSFPRPLHRQICWEHVRGAQVEV